MCQTLSPHFRSFAQALASRTAKPLVIVLVGWAGPWVVRGAQRSTGCEQHACQVTIPEKLLDLLAYAGTFASRAQVDAHAAPPLPVLPACPRRLGRRCEWCRPCRAGRTPRPAQPTPVHVSPWKARATRAADAPQPLACAVPGSGACCCTNSSTCCSASASEMVLSRQACTRECQGTERRRHKKHVTLWIATSTTAGAHTIADRPGASQHVPAWQAQHGGAAPA